MVVQMCTDSNSQRERSLSIPALGTGNLSYPADLVAASMFDAAISFDQTRNRTFASLSEIRFVIYHKDQRTAIV